MGQLVTLDLREGVRLDGKRIAGLLRERGFSGTEALLRSRLQGVASHVAGMQAAYAAGSHGRLAMHSAAISASAAEIGFASIGRVARDAESCAMRGDAVAFRATWTRMHRLSRRSLEVICKGRGARA